jgi:Ion channel
VNRIFERLGRIQPLYYLSAYLMCIPAFAAIYCNMTFGFYGPYAKLEHIAEEDAINVESIVFRAVQKAFDYVDSKQRELKKGELPTVRVVRAEFVAVDDWRLHYRIWVETGSPMAPSTANKFMLSVMNVVVFHPGVAMQFEDDRNSSEKPTALVVSIKQALQTYNPPSFQLSEADAASVRSYLYGLNGDPTQISQSFLRMLYFSVIVITTVGFGDIIPMTTAARSWVAVEAITGIMLAGLFINALAYRASGKSSS